MFRHYFAIKRMMIEQAAEVSPASNITMKMTIDTETSDAVTEPSAPPAPLVPPLTPELQPPPQENPPITAAVTTPEALSGEVSSAATLPPPQDETIEAPGP